MSVQGAAAQNYACDIDASNACPVKLCWPKHAKRISTPIQKFRPWKHLSLQYTKQPTTCRVLYSESECEMRGRLSSLTLNKSEQELLHRHAWPGLRQHTARHASSSWATPSGANSDRLPLWRRASWRSQRRRARTGRRPRRSARPSSCWAWTCRPRRCTRTRWSATSSRRRDRKP